MRYLLRCFLAEDLASPAARERALRVSANMTAFASSLLLECGEGDYTAEQKEQGREGEEGEEECVLRALAAAEEASLRHCAALQELEAGAGAGARSGWQQRLWGAGRRDALRLLHMFLRARLAHEVHDHLAPPPRRGGPAASAGADRAGRGEEDRGAGVAAAVLRRARESYVEFLTASLAFSR